MTKLEEKIAEFENEVDKIEEKYSDLFPKDDKYLPLKMRYIFNKGNINGQSSLTRFSDTVPPHVKEEVCLTFTKVLSSDL
ncbi:MAG: hypothetical protein MUC49_22885 [Raineya sp.]|jgi:hypothetical protein|nr:hypothetical protein [Raineya sp.]